MELSIQQLARAAGTTSRTLRHYDALGILPATRTGAGGYRYYDDGRESLMAKESFGGFDNARYRDEVERRWGRDAAARSEAWWRDLGESDRSAWQARSRQLAADWIAAAAEGDVASASAQTLAERHVAWLHTIPGTPAGDGVNDGDEIAYVRGLGDMYVADSRFWPAYGGEQGARFVRDALRVWIDRNRDTR